MIYINILEHYNDKHSERIPAAVYCEREMLHGEDGDYIEYRGRKLLLNDAKEIDGELKFDIFLSDKEIEENDSF